MSQKEAGMGQWEMRNSSSKEIQILQKKAADLEAKLKEKETEKQGLATALQEVEHQRHEAEAKYQIVEADLKKMSEKFQKKERDYDLLIHQYLVTI